MWMHMGRAGTGKSTSLKFWMYFFPESKIGILNNNCEKTFTLQSMEETWIWIALDIKGDWNIDQTMWNTMVDGGPLAIARKNKSQRQKIFDQHGAIASNVIMRFQDTNGEFIRRLFIHNYKKKPKMTFAKNLEKEIQSNPGPYLKKMNCFYRFKVWSHGSTQLQDDDLPESIVGTLKELRQKVNPLMAFLDSDQDNIITCNQHYFMDKKLFVSEFKKFMNMNKIQTSASTSPTFFADVFESKNCFVTSKIDDLPLDDSQKSEFKLNTRADSKNEWVVGCCLTKQITEQKNYTKVNLGLLK